MTSNLGTDGLQFKGSVYNKTFKLKEHNVFEVNKLIKEYNDD